MASSSVFFKFKSQREPTRVEFDGTGIEVFELKREIVLRSGLGDGTDFDLAIFADEAMKEEYDDDTVIIPRSTTVIARRMPPKIPGKGGAARYVTGKMPAHAKNASRREQAAKPKGSSKPMMLLTSNMTDEEKMAAVFQAQTEGFRSREEEMSAQVQTRQNFKKHVNVPDHAPPPGYICYRCSEKGHWIQLCPTNDDPEFNKRPRVKRTTGIPKSFLKTVDKATALGQNGADGDDAKTPSGVMVNADGEFVIAQPDKASWEKFQAKAMSNGASNKSGSSSEEAKKIRERGLECPADARMFIDPMKTPCCAKTYCNDCITNALIESDFVCPACKAEGVLLDDLKPDEDALERVKAYGAEKESRARGGGGAAAAANSLAGAASPPSAANGGTAEAKPSRTKSASPSPSVPLANAPSGVDSQTAATSGTTVSSSGKASPGGNNAGDQGQISKKRPAGEPAENPKVPKAPKVMQNQDAASQAQTPAQQQQQQQQQQQAMMQQMLMGGGDMTGMMPMFPGMGSMPMMNSMGVFPGMGGMPDMNMGMPMNPMMMNPMMGFQNMNGAGGPGAFGGGMNNGGTHGVMNGSAGPSGGGMWSASNMSGNAMAKMNGHMTGMGPDQMSGASMNGMGGNNNYRNGGGYNNSSSSNNQNGINSQQQNARNNYNNPSHQQYSHQNQQQQMMAHKNFSHQPADEDDAYFRKPVNPHRHQNRTKRIRPSDYREL